MLKLTSKKSKNKTEPKKNHNFTIMSISIVLPIHKTKNNIETTKNNSENNKQLSGVPDRITVASELTVRLKRISFVGPTLLRTHWHALFYRLHEKVENDRLAASLAGLRARGCSGARGAITQQG